MTFLHIDMLPSESRLLGNDTVTSVTAAVSYTEARKQQVQLQGYYGYLYIVSYDHTLLRKCLTFIIIWSIKCQKTVQNLQIFNTDEI